MLGVRSAARYAGFPRPPLAGYAFRRKPGRCGKRILTVASCRSRKLGTAFRSPVTTLSQPLRGQCSRPAPSLPRKRSSHTRSIRNSSLDSVFEAEPGEFIAPDPLHPPISSAPVSFAGLHSPLGRFQPSGSKRSTGLLTGNSPRLTSALSFRSPPLVLSIALRIDVQNCASPCLAIVP